MEHKEITGFNLKDLMAILLRAIWLSLLIKPMLLE
jgi:hypothetical protein